MSTPKDPVERFLKYVNKTETCWLWTGTTGGSGARYGYFYPGPRNGRHDKIPAHRFSYETWVGPIPEGMEIDHVAARGCTSKLCVNPAHLEPVDHAENRRRGRLTVCRKGLHEILTDNDAIFDTAGNRRGCRKCKNESVRQAYYRRKGKK